MQREIDLAGLERHQALELHPPRTHAGGADGQRATVGERDLHVVENEAFVADLHDAAMDLDLVAEAAQPARDRAQVQAAANLGLLRGAAQPGAHVRAALRIGDRVGRDEGQQARADVAVDVGLDVGHREPWPETHLSGEPHRCAVDRDREVLEPRAGDVERDHARPDHDVAVEVLGP